MGLPGFSSDSVDGLKLANGVSARLFRLFELKKRVLKKAQPTFAFGKLKTQLFYKSCVLSIEKKLRKMRKGLWTLRGP